MIESDAFAAVIEKHIKIAVDSSIESYVEKTIAALVIDPDWIAKIENQINRNFQRRFDEKLSTVDFNQLIKQHIDSGVERWQSLFRQNFSTQGITDLAQTTQLTVKDDGIKIQGDIDCRSITVNDDASVAGTLSVKNLCVHGTVNTDNSSWNELVQHIADAAMQEIVRQWQGELVDQVLLKAKQNGIDFDQVTINGSPLVNGDTLNHKITQSNIKQLGALKDLVVTGKAQINETLNVSAKRVGINTDLPEMALGLWDEEVSISVGKYDLNHAFIGTTRSQILSLGVNREPYLDIDSDGTTTVRRFRINQHRIGFETKVPGYSGTRGDIIFNSDPKPGQPLAWQCLGGFKWQIIQANI